MSPTHEDFQFLSGNHFAGHRLWAACFVLVREVAPLSFYTMRCYVVLGLPVDI